MRRLIVRTLISILATVATSVGATDSGLGGLSREEARIASWIDEHLEEGVDLLKRQVEVNSGTLNPEGVRDTGRILEAELERLGFTIRWVELPPDLDRGPHLVAEHRGGGDPAVLLIGHLDTVFEPDSPFQQFERHEETASGPGVLDMKGGNVAIVLALAALESVGALDELTVTAYFTGDEESPGLPHSVSRADLEVVARASDVALGFEAGSRDDEGDLGVVARRSASGWTLRVQGRRAHSSGIFSEEVGAGAVFEAARILDAFYDELTGEEYLTFNPGVIVGGTEVDYDETVNRGTAYGKTNVVAQEVVVEGGIRTLTDDQLQSARQRMVAIAAASRPQTSAELTFDAGYPSMPPTPGNGRLLSLYDEVSRDLGYGPVRPFDPGKRGAADVSFAAPHCDALGGLGPQGEGSHTMRETVELPSIAKAAKRAALLVYRLSREGPPSPP